MLNGFLIRRYDEGLNPFWQLVSQEIEVNTGVRLQAVWDAHHNEKIDDRILREIDESSLVVLDISERFNVGFEAGYALKGRKELVVVRHKQAPIEEAPIPFDIRTRNVTEYDTNDLDTFVEALSSRILIAIRSLHERKCKIFSHQDGDIVGPRPLVTGVIAPTLGPCRLWLAVSTIHKELYPQCAIGWKGLEFEEYVRVGLQQSEFSNGQEFSIKILSVSPFVEYQFVSGITGDSSRDYWKPEVQPLEFKELLSVRIIRGEG